MGKQKFASQTDLKIAVIGDEVWLCSPVFFMFSSRILLQDFA